MLINYSRIYEFWNNNPCAGGNKNFPFRFFSHAKVLEIGCGAGEDAIRFVNAGSRYTGIDLTDKSIELTKLKIGSGGMAVKMNAERIDFPDNHFDLVYSWGVIHHAMSPQNIVNEIYRVTQPGGFVYVMLYNKFSFRYLVEIMFLRKILWHLRYWKYSSIRKEIPNPTKQEWISINTDNIGCPLSMVYTKKQAESLFKNFSQVRSFTENFGWFRIIIAVK